MRTPREHVRSVTSVSGYYTKRRDAPGIAIIFRGGLGRERSSPQSLLIRHMYPNWLLKGVVLGRQKTHHVVKAKIGDTITHDRKSRPWGTSCHVTIWRRVLLPKSAHSWSLQSTEKRIRSSLVGLIGEPRFDLPSWRQELHFRFVPFRVGPCPPRPLLAPPHPPPAPALLPLPDPCGGGAAASAHSKNLQLWPMGFPQHRKGRPLFGPSLDTVRLWGVVTESADKRLRMSLTSRAVCASVRQAPHSSLTWHHFKKLQKSLFCSKRRWKQ